MGKTMVINGEKNEDTWEEQGAVERKFVSLSKMENRENHKNNKVEKVKSKDKNTAAEL